MLSRWSPDNTGGYKTGFITWEDVTFEVTKLELQTVATKGLSPIECQWWVCERLDSQHLCEFSLWSNTCEESPQYNLHQPLNLQVLFICQEETHHESNMHKRVESEVKMKLDLRTSERWYLHLSCHLEITGCRPWSKVSTQWRTALAPNNTGEEVNGVISRFHPSPVCRPACWMLAGIRCNLSSS